MFRVHLDSVDRDEQRSRLFTWDELMQYIPVYILWELAGLFAASERDCRDAVKASGVHAGSNTLDDKTRQNWKATFEKAKSTPQFVSFLPFSTGSIQRLIDALDDPATKLWDVGELIRDLQRRITDELRPQIHVLIDSVVAPLVLEPLGGWKAAVARYPEVQPEVIEASMCMAVDRWTACVFHLMRILEHGLRALALELETTEFPEHENWKNIIDHIEKKIREMGKLPKTPDKTEKLQRYSEMASQFRYFKDAWRNHVSHAKSIYDGNQAGSVYNHVRDFMQKMAADA